MYFKKFGSGCLEVRIWGLRDMNIREYLKIAMLG